MTTSRLARLSLLTAWTLALPAIIAARPTRPTTASADGVLARSKAVYAALHTYADSGTVLLEYGPADAPQRDRHAFHTYYRAPRSFYFDFVKAGNADRYVVWSDDQAVHTWWKTTGLVDSYGKGQGVNAFVMASSPTKNSVGQIASLLFPGSPIVSTLSEFGDATDAGIEKLDGHDCYKLMGVAKDVYRATLKEVNIRRTIVWIDKQTLLVRKVQEDPKNTMPGTVNRTTTTFSPHANPSLTNANFQFTPPGAQP